MKVKRGSLKPVYGSVREQRFPHALRPEYAPIEERTQADRLAFATVFAPLLRFYDESNSPVSDWSPFFDHDVAFLLAQIVTADMRREQFDSWALYNRSREGTDQTAEILKTVSQMVGRMDRWYQRSVEIATRDAIGKNDFRDNPLVQTLESIIRDDLAPHLGANLEDALNQLPHKPGEEPWLSQWRQRQQRVSDIWKSPPTVRPAAASADSTPMDRMFSILYALHIANSRLQDVAAQYLAQVLEKSDHAPHVALYMAFVQLLELFRDKINTVTGRHLDFYYRDVLRLKERGMQPDVAHVCFTADPRIPGVMLPAGTRLNAGKDASGEVREYTTDADLFINQARVAYKQALYLARDRFATSKLYPDRVVSIAALPKADSENGEGQPLTYPSAGWPTFGVDETAGAVIDPSYLPAELGIIVASPALLLQEGERNVTVTITFVGENSLEDALRNYQSLANEILDSPPHPDVLLADAFSVALSGQKGWMPVVKPTFRHHPVVGTKLEIEFTLDAANPAVVANPSLSPEPRNACWPMLKLSMNPFARVFPYPLLNDLEIDTIDFRICVSGLQKMQIANEFGPLNAAQPFPFFGPIPALGSYLLIAHPELAVKRVEHVALTITWFNLPVVPENMVSYYSAYNLGINNDSFRMRSAIFGAGKWQAPLGGHDVFPMFTRDFDDGGLAPSTTLELEIPDIPTAVGPALPGAVPDLPTDARSPRGSLRLELAQPAFAFAHATYPKVMAEVATANARAGKNDHPKPLPNAPLSPVAKSLSLDYEATDRLVLSHPLPENQAGSFFTLFPFGYAAHQGHSGKILANFQEQGHLYLGMLETGPQQTISLLFQIRDAGFSPVPQLRHHQDTPEKPLQWRYLSHNQWKDFPKLLLLSDTTMGLTRSGIIKITLPPDITIENTMMPAGVYWLEAALEHVTQLYWCHMVSIATQAVTATRVCGPKSDLAPAVLPAGSITQLSVKNPQIKMVTQPFASTGGRSPENAADFRARVSERLRHKDRAVQAFDYERLILDEFPEVGQVKCIGRNSSRHFPGNPAISPGMLFIVAAPRLQDVHSDQPRLPQEVLRRIENFLSSHTSIFVKDIHVINPVYETLKVFVQVEFVAEGDVSYYYDDLNAVICQYLRPWLREAGSPLYIGSGQVQGYELAKFIQQQPYVKRLQSLKMLHTYQTETGYVSDWRSVEQRVWASAAWAVLTPAARHGIVAVEPAQADIDEGIRNLTVGNDFVMGSPLAKEKKEDQLQQRYFLVVPKQEVQGHAGR